MEVCIPKKIRLGVLLPTRGLLLKETNPTDAGLVIRLAQRVEEAGLDSVWVGDSLIAKPRLEPLTTLAAVAAVTERVRLGTAVLLMALRNPVLLAQSMATVDLISRGRLIIAAGAGGAFNQEQQQEWKVAGVQASRRASRLEEMVKILKGLGSGEPFDFQGRHFDLNAVTMMPRPVQADGIPILLACHWRGQAREAQAERAARLADGIISISDTPEEYSQLVQKVGAQRAELGKESAAWESAMYLTVNMKQDRVRAQAEAEQFLLGYYGSEIWGDRWGPFGDPARVKDRLLAYAEAGAQTLIVRFASYEPERQLETFLEKVAPFID